MAFPGLPGRAFESLLQLLQVFLISTLALVPGQSDRELSIEFLAIAVVSWVAQVTVQIRYLRARTGHPWSWITHRAVLAQFATVAGARLRIFVHRGHCERMGPAGGNIALKALSNNEDPSP